MDEIFFSESIVDFASLINEYGGEKVGTALRKSFPEEVIAIYGHLASPPRQEAALFKPINAPLTD